LIRQDLRGRPVRVGIQLPEVERMVRWPEYVAMARAAEEVGFDSIWLGDHLLYRDDGLPERGPWDAWTMLGGLATVTDRVAFGPLVACTAFHPPGVLARMAAAVDELSGGRLVLGLGAGWNEPEFRAFGLPFDHRASRFEEAFEIIRRLLAGERVTLAGRFHTVEDAVLLPRPSRRPTLMVGSFRERVLRATLPHVDVWNVWYEDYGNTPDGFAKLSGDVRSIAERVGRPWEEIERSACLLVAPEGGERPDRWEAPPIAGSMRQIASGIHELAEAGADEVILVVTPITERSIRDLGQTLRLLDA
jgi:alkanesulfonate monooxygenase SsuD/methylene tetrahydromethanopterin reductase-like flavin-dependent oxidoreductase (luciferase family)